MDLLGAYTLEEEDLIVQSATQKKQEHVHIIAERIQHFNLRSVLIEQYFLRLSTKNKVGFILQLIDLIEPFTTFSQIFHVLPLGRLKKHSYQIVGLQHQTVYDSILIDHNRMLGKICLEETMETDLTWYSTLDDVYQATLVVRLLRASGGNVKRRLYIPMYRRYIHRLGTFHYGVPIVSDVSRMSEVTELYLEDFEEYVSKSPENLEVEKQRKKWEEVVAKYKQELNLQADRLYHYDERELKVKSDKPKNEKSDGKSTNAKTGRGKNVDSKLNTVDVIQLLPIWIVKIIFSYLDEKTLKHIKTVNNYWAYVAQEVITDVKARQQLNKSLQQMKAMINPDTFDKVMKDLTKTNITKKPPPKSVVTLGSLAIKLVPNENKPVTTKSVVKQVINTKNTCENGSLSPFPRIIENTLSPLYRYQPCMLRDIDLKTDVEEDIVEQKSFLTYSLTSLLSSVRFTVDPTVLSDW